jgi:hypothetical protein
MADFRFKLFIAFIALSGCRVQSQSPLASEEISGGSPAVIAPAVEVILNKEKVTPDMLRQFRTIETSALVAQLSALNLRVWYILPPGQSLLAFLDCDVRQIGACDKALAKARSSTLFQHVSKDVDLSVHAPSLEKQRASFNEQVKLGLSVNAVLRKEAAKTFSSDLSSMSSAVQSPLSERLLERGFAVTGSNADKLTVTGYLRCANTSGCETTLDGLREMDIVQHAGLIAR